MLEPELTNNLLSVRVIDLYSAAVVLVWDACYILSEGDAVRACRVLNESSVVGKVNDREQ